MRNVTFPASNDVTTPEGVVTWDGRTGEATDVSITAEIPSHLPDQVSGMGGISGATGSVDWAFGADVTTTTESPWTTTTPEPGDPITIDLGRDRTTARVFTGMVDDSGGSASEGVKSSGITDNIRQLDKPISMRPLCSVMPAPTSDGATNQRNIDLMSTYFVDRVLRHCDFYSTPPRLAYCVMSAPLQGSTWPEVGTLWTSNREGTIQNSPWWTEAPWGVAAKSFFADYRPDIAQWGGVDGTLSSRAMEISFCAGPVQRTSGRIAVEWGDGAALAVSITSSRSVIAQVRFSNNGVPGEWQSIVTATAGELGTGWRVASARFAPRGDNTMGISIKADTGVELGPRASSIPYSVLTRAVENVNVRFTDSTVGGIQVAFPGRAHESTNHIPNAVLSPPPTFTSLTGSPLVKSTPAIELLKEWSEAECAAMWIDEDGIFRWVNRDKFITGPVQWTGTSLDNLLDYDWSHTADGVRSGATVRYTTVAVRRSKRVRIPVWQGSGQTMEPGDIVEEIITPDNDKAWLGVNSGFQVFQAETSKQAFNKGEGNWVGYVGYDKDGNEHGNGQYAGYAHTVEYIDIDTWKLTQTWAGHVPTGVDHLKLQTRDGGTALKPQWQGHDLPVMRAQGELTFEDISLSASVSGAPRWAAELTHDTGWWIQTRAQARALAFWLAQQTAKPFPVVDEVRIMPDARLQRGDKIRVTDSHKTGVSIVGVINKIQHRITNGHHEMVLRLVVTLISADKPTLAEYDAAFSGATLSVRDETWGTSTLAQFDADPLKR